MFEKMFVHFTGGSATQCHQTKVEFLNTLSETRWNLCPDVSLLLFENMILAFGEIHFQDL